MKKLLTMLLALALLAGTLTLPALADNALISWNGFECKVTDYSYSEGKDGRASLRVDVSITNNTSRALWMTMKNVMIDGTEIYGAGVFNIKPNSPKTDWLLFKPNDENPDGGDGAIRTGSQLDMDLILMDDDTNEELYRQSVSLNLYDLSVGGEYSDDFDDDYGADFGHGGASSGNTAPAYTPASYDFTTLKKGSKGQAVRDLQQRLTDLGYLNDKVDGSYGTNTSIAVMGFCKQNGLYISTDASPEMQQFLYSSNAQYYVEPYIPLVIGTEYKWTSNARNDVGTFYIQLVNRSRRGIRGYELDLYCLNMWDETIHNDDGGWLYKYEEQQFFNPGDWKNSNPLVFGPFAYTYTVMAGIRRIVFDDGEIREVDFDDIQWFPCVVKNK